MIAEPQGFLVRSMRILFVAAQEENAFGGGRLRYGLPEMRHDESCELAFSFIL